MGVKKLTAILLIICMMLSIMPTAFAAGTQKFVDFPTGWSAPAMTAAVQNGLIQGVSETEIKPADNLTRAEFATIIARAFGAETTADISNFKDVAPSAWYYEYIARAVKMEVLNGKSTSEMDPDAFITREEVFTALARVLVLSSDDSSSLNRFYDKAEISDWAVASLSAMSARGYVNGDDTGNLNPKSNITREEFAQVMYNTIKRYITSTGIYGGSLEGITVVRAGNITLRDASVSGDLVIGDGAGVGAVVIENTTIQGRLLVRGGTMTLKNFKIAEDLVVVKNVNGITNFNNYRSEFKEVIELTPAKFLSQGGSIGGGPSGPGGTLSYAVTIVNPSGGTQVISVPRGQIPNLSSYVVPTGYTHSGQFYLDAAKTRPYVLSSANSSFTLYPDLTPIPYTITYVLPQGSAFTTLALDGTETTTYTIETPMVTLPVQSKFVNFPAEHRFDGWYDNPSFTGSPITSFNAGQVDDKTFYAKIVSLTGYTVTWKNDDGTVLETDTNVLFGAMPSYDSATPTKASTAQYSYTFNTWTPAISAVTGDVIYTATFTPTFREYTITWKNYDGTTLDTSTVAYGSTPSYTGATPTKPSTAQYDYTFSGWTPTVSAVTGEATYTATFTPTLREYTITWKNYDGTTLDTDEVEYGLTPAYTGATPTKPSTVQYDYTFSGWTPAVSAVTGEATYTATFTETLREYTITWKNYDGTTLGTSTVAYGSTPSYTGATPTKPSTVQYDYTFSGWTPAVSAVTGEATYTATFTETLREYTITWKNHDGTTLDTDEVAYGATPVYAGATPTKPSTVQYDYTFSGWTPALSAVTGDVIYTATFTETLRKYTIIWKNYDDTTLDTDEVEYGLLPVYGGLTPIRLSDRYYNYTFGGWLPSVVNVVDNATYTATFNRTAIEYSIAYKYETGNLSLSIDGNEVEFLPTAPARTTRYTVEDTVSLPALTDVVVPTGYKIEGWYYAADLSLALSGTSFTGIIPDSGDTLTLYAHVVEKDKITVKFDLNYDNKIHATPAILPGLALGQLMPADPTRAGYDFGGWYIDGDFNDASKKVDETTIFNQAEGSTVVVYAKWNVIPYSINYTLPIDVTLDGSQPTEYNVETEVTLPTTFASMPTGYEFEGWYENNTGSRVEKIQVGTTGDKNYTLRIKPIVYDITYFYDHATVTGMTMTYTIEDVVSMPAVTPDLGYEFNGWYNNSEFDGGPITSMAQGNTGDKNFYAKVDAIPYFIYYSFPDGGSFIDPDDNVGEYTIEQTVTLPTGGVMILPRGYKFDGWIEVPVPTVFKMRLMLLADVLNEDNFVTTIERGTTGHKAYEAQISPIEYQINYHYPSGTSLDGNETTMFTILDTVTLPTTLLNVPFGYEFRGWYENDQYTGSKVTGFVAEQLVDLEDKDYYAWVAPIEYDIEYVLPDGTTLDGTQTKKYTIEQAVTLPTEANVKPLAGYKFDGWFDNKECQGTPVTGFDAGETGKKIYYASVSPIDYTISYEFGATGASFKDGVIPDTEYIVTDTVTLPVKDDITVPTGMKFAGWYYNSTYTDGPVDSFKGKIPATGEILTLYARVIPEDQYTIYFRKELTDTENYAMPTIYSGTALGDKMPKDPEKDGHTFDGWYIDGLFDDETKKIDETTTFTADTYVYAKWDTNLYTVRFIKGETVHKTLTNIPYNTVLSDESYWQGLPVAPEETIYTKLSKYSEFVYPFDEPFKIADVYYYEKEDGTWARFDDTVVVTHDIDAYLMDKRFSMTVKIPSRSTPFGPDTPYVPGETRMMDTLKAILSNGGDTINILQDTEIFKKVENKATQLLVDKNVVYKHDNGDLEIMISELPINITRIVDGQRARQTVKQYVEDVINDPNKLDSMLDMIDINDLVDQIGTSTLISKLSDKQIVDMMKDPANAETVENGIYSAIGNSDIQEIMISYLNDTMLADGAFRTEIAEEFKNQLASDATLREQILGDTALLESVLGQDNIKAIVADVILSDDVLEIAVTDDTFKATLIEKIVGNEDIRNKVSATTLFKNYVLTQIKTDDTLKDKIREKLATDASLRETIITNSDLLDLFLDDGTLKATIISSAVDNDLFISKIIENDGLKELIINNMSGNQDFIDLLIHTDAFADFIVSALHTPGSPFKTHVLELLEEDSVKADMHEIIKDNDDFRAELASDELKAQVMDSIDEYISHGDIDDLVAYIWHRTLGDTYTGGREADYQNFITDVMVEEFKGILYDHRPDKALGWNEFFDYLTSNSDAREDVKASADADVRAKIDTELTQYKEDVLADFIDDGVITNPDGTENLDIENEIDVAILEIIKEYIRTETTGNADADAHIEHEMVEYTKTIVMSEPDDLHQDLVVHIEHIKEDFKESIIDIDNDILIQSIIDFRDDSQDNKLILTDVIDDNFASITTYIKENVVGDSELMGTISDMIADFAYSLSNELINELIEFIGDGHTVISTIVSEYIGGLSEDELKVEINTFVEETSDADILSMVQELRDDPTLDLKGVIQGDEIYSKITEYLVDNIGNGTIYAKVDNVLKTQAGNIDNDTVADLILTLLNDPDNSYLVTDYLAGYVTNSENETKVRGYIADFIESDTLDEDFIRENRATIESVINSVDISGMITNDFIKTYISKLEGTEKDEFINDVYDAVLELDYFKEFITVFDNKGESFEINKDNLAFVKAISDGINGFTYDSIIEYVSFKGFDKIEELLGDRFLEPIFNKAKEDYVEGLNDAIAEVEADDTKTVNYTTSMVFKVDIINDVLVKLYDEATEKAVSALNRVDGLRYDQNDYLYSLVEYNNLLEEMFENANRADGDPLNETLTGWKLRTPTEYYDVALGKVILLDDAICWYGDNLTEDQLDAMLSSVINKGFAVHDRLNGIINDYDLYHSFPEPVQKVIDKVSYINSFITKYQTQIDSLVDGYLNSGLNQKFEASDITEKPKYDEIIDIIFGTEEHPIFNVDSVYFLMEKAADSEFRAKLHKKLVDNEPRIMAALDKFQNTDFGRLLDGIGNSTVTSMADKLSEFASSGKITSAYSGIYDVLLHISDPNIGPDAFKITVDDPSIKAVEDAYRISIKGIQFKFMRYYK